MIVRLTYLIVKYHDFRIQVLTEVLRLPLAEHSLHTGKMRFFRVKAANKKMKSLNLIRKLLFITSGIVGCWVVAGAVESDDHTVVADTAQTVEQLVREELQSDKFAAQIASYNGLPSATTVLAAGTTLAIPRPYMRVVNFGRIAYVKGDVLLSQTDFVVNPPAKGSHVFNGDVLETGSDGFVSLAFNSGASVNLQPDSRVMINDIDCVKAEVRCVISVHAAQGQVHSEVTPRPDGQPPVQFSIDTPFLTAAVRGTAFYLDLDDAENRIGVTKGLVAAETAGAQNDLPEGKGLSAKPGVVAEVVELLDAPELTSDSEEILISREDVVGWNVLEGAQSYQASVATDDAMSQLVVVQNTDRLVFSPELQPGDYHLTVAGVDDKEFIGLPARQKISYAEISDSEKPEISIIRRGGTVELSVNHSGRAQLLIGKSIDSDVYTSRTLENASDTLLLDLDETQEWVFRTRKLIGPYEVSAYSDFYVLSGD